MARFSFGGASDLSGIFADMYRLGDAQAARERNAEDENVINKWETGEMSDAEFYAYAQRRIEESAGDPEERSQWEQILRNARQTNEGEVIQDTAEDIMDGIEAGTRTWDDLLNYYKAQRRKLRPSDPLYRELSQQIDQVEDRKRDNEVASIYGSIDYRFRSGQISGAQAGKELRALAERYKQNDPQKYYELLGQALDLENPKVSGGSGGGSGSGSGSGDGLKGTINELEGMESRLLALSKQARDGQRVGSVTLPGPDGVPVTETFNLLTKGGLVTGELRAIHEQTLLLYDELEQAHLADGNVDAAGEDAERRATYITDYVQPANTISKERQWGMLVDDFVGTVQSAVSAESPAKAWLAIQRQADRLARWGSKLNTRTTSTDVEKRASDAKVRENPELAAAVRRQTTSEETNIARRILPEFEQDVLAQIEAITKAVKSDDPDAILAAFEDLPEDSPLVDAAAGMAANRRVAQGLADGSFQMVMTADGIKPLEVIRDQVGVGPDGGPLLMVAALADASGEVVWQYDPRTDGPMTQVLSRVGSEYMPVLATTQQQVVASEDFEWDGVEYRRGQAVPQDVLNAIEKAPEGTPPPPVGPMLVTRLPGGETFYGLEQSDGNVGWYRNRVPRNLNIPALPSPYVGPAENAQAAFTRMGLDPTGRTVLDNAVATGNRVSMRAYDKFAGPQANVQRATSDVGYQAPRVIDPGARLGSGTYRPLQGTRGAPGAFGPERPTLTLAQTLAAVRGDTDPLSNIKQIGQSLGIRGLSERQQRGGALATRRIQNIDMVRPTIRSVARPNVVRPNVNVGALRNMSAQLKAMRSRIAASTQSFSAPKVTQLQKIRSRSDSGFI